MFSTAIFRFNSLLSTAEFLSMQDLVHLVHLLLDTIDFMSQFLDHSLDF